MKRFFDILGVLNTILMVTVPLLIVAYTAYVYSPELPIFILCMMLIYGMFIFAGNSDQKNKKKEKGRIEAIKTLAIEKVNRLDKYEAEIIDVQGNRVLLKAGNKAYVAIAAKDKVQLETVFVAGGILYEPGN